MFTTGALRLDWVRVRQRVKMAPVPAHQITSCCLLKQKHSNVQISSGKNITKYWSEHPGLDGLFLTRQGRNKSSGVQLYSHQLKQTRLGNKVNFYNWNFLLNIANRYHCELQCHHNQNYTYMVFLSRLIKPFWSGQFVSNLKKKKTICTELFFKFKEISIELVSWDGVCLKSWEALNSIWHYNSLVARK